MGTQTLPSIEEYNAHTNDLVSSGSLTIEQAIILQVCYRRTLDDLPTNINYLMQVTGLNWKEINWVCNGLVMRKALTVPEKKWYMTKIAQ
jgi:uncharacterized membrane protein